jgi:hypothetical protein
MYACVYPYIIVARVKNNDVHDNDMHICHYLPHIAVSCGHTHTNIIQNEVHCMCVGVLMLIRGGARKNR